MSQLWTDRKYSVVLLLSLQGILMTLSSYRTAIVLIFIHCSIRQLQ